MGAVDEAVGVEDFEILANRNLRSFELARQFSDQNPALVGQQIENGATAFFVEHGNNSLRRTVRQICGTLTAGFLHSSCKRQV